MNEKTTTKGQMKRKKYIIASEAFLKEKLNLF